MFSKNRPRKVTTIGYSLIAIGLLLVVYELAFAIPQEFAKVPDWEGTYIDDFIFYALAVALLSLPLLIVLLGIRVLQGKIYTKVKLSYFLIATFGFEYMVTSNIPYLMAPFIVVLLPVSLWMDQALEDEECKRYFSKFEKKYEKKSKAVHEKEKKMFGTPLVVLGSTAVVVSALLYFLPNVFGHVDELILRLAFILGVGIAFIAGVVYKGWLDFLNLWKRI